MEPSDKARRPKLADSVGEADHLSALPDDLLISILLRLDSATAAGRTSVLSSRWRSLWAQLPELHFGGDTDPHRIRSALDAHEAPELQLLVVSAEDASPESVAVWLPTAARRVSGALLFRNSRQGDEAEGGGDLVLPCFAQANEIWLNLEVLSLALPPSGVFAHLTRLYLDDIRLSDPPCGLGEAVSSPRSPCLRLLCLVNVRNLGDLTIRSKSLVEMELWELQELQNLTVEAPALENLTVHHCLIHASTSNELVASISAPQLVSLMWTDAYNPRSVQLGKMPDLRELVTASFLVYGLNQSSAPNRGIVSLLRRFERLNSLTVSLAYQPVIGNCKFLMEELTRLPDITSLVLGVTTCEHSFGASLFHLLRMCTAITELKLEFYAKPEWQKETVCPSDCICNEPQNWKTEELVLDSLEEVEITYLEGTEHDFAFVKRLLCWATVLKKMTVTFDDSMTESRAEELQKWFLRFCGPEIVNFRTLPRLE